MICFRPEGAAGVVASQFVQSVDHWLALGRLGAAGIHML